jgi:serine/threonine protein kinase
MEYLEGRRLDRVIAEESPLPYARIRELLAELAAGLREAHSLGVVHRDLKPSNVLITASRLKILDFGIAATAGAQARLTRAGFIMGSPMFMSPDQILGHPPDARTDLYSLGLLAYCMITGREPFVGVEPYALVHKQLREAPPDVRLFRPDVPAAWLALLAGLLAKKREKRFQSAQEVLDALAELPVDVPAAASADLGVPAAPVVAQ